MSSMSFIRFCYFIITPRHAELVSAPHLLSTPCERRLYDGIPKQVRDDVVFIIYISSTAGSSQSGKNPKSNIRNPKSSVRYLRPGLSAHTPAGITLMAGIRCYP